MKGRTAIILIILFLPTLAFAQDQEAEERSAHEQTLVLIRTETVRPERPYFSLGTLISSDGFVLAKLDSIRDRPYSGELSDISFGLVYTHPDGQVDVHNFEQNGGVMVHDWYWVSGDGPTGLALVKLDLPPSVGEAPFARPHEIYAMRDRPIPENTVVQTTGIAEQDGRMIIRTHDHRVVNLSGFATHDVPLEKTVAAFGTPLAEEGLFTTGSAITMQESGPTFINGAFAAFMIAHFRGSGHFVEESTVLAKHVPSRYARHWFGLGAESYQGSRGYQLPADRLAYFAETLLDPLFDLQMEWLASEVARVTLEVGASPGLGSRASFFYELYCYLMLHPMHRDLDNGEEELDPIRRAAIGPYRQLREGLAPLFDGLAALTTQRIDGLSGVEQPDQGFIRSIHLEAQQSAPIEWWLPRLGPESSFVARPELGGAEQPYTPTQVQQEVVHLLFYTSHGVALRHLSRHRPVILKFPASWPDPAQQAIRNSLFLANLDVAIQFGDNEPTPISSHAAKLLFDWAMRGRPRAPLDSSIAVVLTGEALEDVYVRDPETVRLTINLLIAFHQALTDGEVNGERAEPVQTQVAAMLAEFAYTPEGADVLLSLMPTEGGSVEGLPDDLTSALREIHDGAEAKRHAAISKCVSAGLASGVLRPAGEVVMARVAVLEALNEAMGHLTAYGRVPGSPKIIPIQDLTRTVRALNF